MNLKLLLKEKKKQRFSIKQPRIQSTLQDFSNIEEFFSSPQKSAHKENTNTNMITNPGCIHSSKPMLGYTNNNKIDK